MTTVTGRCSRCGSPAERMIEGGGMPLAPSAWWHTHPDQTCYGTGPWVGVTARFIEERTDG